MKTDDRDKVTIHFGISNDNPGNCLLGHIIILGKYTIYLKYAIVNYQAAFILTEGQNNRNSKKYNF